MLGIQDKWVALAYILCIAATVLCIVYGIIFWNKGHTDAEPEDTRWAEEEQKVEEEL